MRGSPTLHLALLIALFIALAVPLARLTSAKPVTTVAAMKVDSKSVPVRVKVRFAHAPTSIALKMGVRDLLAGVERETSSMETETALSLPKEGIELHAAATWPAGTPETALTIILEPSEQDAVAQTIWSNAASLDEVVLFQWRVAP